jgi:hypothetical protein
MTTVSQGTSSAYTFAANEMATLALSGGQQARVEVVDAITGKVKYGASTSVSETFGPFNVNDALTVTAIRGTVVYTISTYTPPVVGGTSTIAGATDYNTATLPAEQAAIAGKVSAPTNWAAATNTPALTSGTAVLGSAYKNTSTGVTTLGAAIDGITVVNNGDMLVCFTAGTYTLVPANNIVPPRTEGATVTLAALDNAGISATPVNCVVTVNTGLGAGFGRGFVGAGVVTFNGTATVVDHRTTGATNPACALTCIAADSYYVIGSKA